MTDEHGGTVPDQDPESSVVESRSVSSSEMFSSSEGRVALGGAIIIAGWLFFEVILNDYGTNFVPLLLAILAVLLPRSNEKWFERIAPLSTIMKTLGYLIGIIAVVSLIEDIRFASGALDDFTEILGALVLYGGSAVAFMGARAIK